MKTISPSFRRVAHQYMSKNGSYYKHDPSLPLQEIARRWKEEDEQFAVSQPIMMPLDEVWPYREYTRTREVGRRNPEQWDELRESMRATGWDKNFPLGFYIGREGGMKVGEGNHRLAIARELRIRNIPVWVVFIKRRVAGSSDLILGGASKS